MDEGYADLADAILNAKFDRPDKGHEFDQVWRRGLQHNATFGRHFCYFVYFAVL